MNKKPDKENFLKNIDLKKVTGNSFVKITDSPGANTCDNASGISAVGEKNAAFEKIDLKSTDRVALNRKGNQFFNEGKIDVAKRIFITTGYSDGLTRVGDHYYKTNNYLEALKMYTMAPAPEKKDELIRKISNVIIRWIN